MKLRQSFLICYLRYCNLIYDAGSLWTATLNICSRKYTRWLMIAVTSSGRWISWSSIRRISRMVRMSTGSSLLKSWRTSLCLSSLISMMWVKYSWKVYFCLNFQFPSTVTSSLWRASGPVGWSRPLMELYFAMSDKRAIYSWGISLNCLLSTCRDTLTLVRSLQCQESSSLQVMLPTW